MISLVWGTNGKWAAQRVQCGRVTAKLGRRTKNASSGGSREGNVCNDALHVIGLCGPGDKISLVLQDWELAKLDLSCRMVLDMLRQGKNGPW